MFFWWLWLWQWWQWWGWWWWRRRIFWTPCGHTCWSGVRCTRSLPSIRLLTCAHPPREMEGGGWTRGGGHEAFDNCSLKTISSCLNPSLQCNDKRHDVQALRWYSSPSPPSHIYLTFIHCACLKNLLVQRLKWPSVSQCSHSHLDPIRHPSGRSEFCSAYPCKVFSNVSSDDLSKRRHKNCCNFSNTHFKLW